MNRSKGIADAMATLNQVLLWGIPSCWRVLGCRTHCSTSLLLLVFFKNVSLVNPSLDPACYGEVVASWVMHQVTVEALKRMRLDAYLLAQHLDGRLALAESLLTIACVHLAVTPSTDEALHDLGTFASVALYLFYVGGIQFSNSSGAPPHVI